MLLDIHRLFKLLLGIRPCKKKCKESDGRPLISNNSETCVGFLLVFMWWTYTYTYTCSFYATPAQKKRVEELIRILTCEIPNNTCEIGEEHRYQDTSQICADPWTPKICMLACMATASFRSHSSSPAGIQRLIHPPRWLYGNDASSRQRREGP